MKKAISLILAVCMLFLFAACGSGEQTKSITIAYQGGIGYAPVHVLQAKQLIEQAYKEKTGSDITVNFQKLDSGADINTGIIGGTIDIGCMGIAPAISAVANGIPAKIMTGLCSQTHGLMTSDENIKTLADIKDEQIALVNIGSIQHILLAMACEQELGDAHALDNNIVKMSHAEGYAALEAGTYKLHLTSSPFINRERESGKFYEIQAVNDIWPDGNIFLVALASEKLSEDAELFEVISECFSSAISFINENEQESAEIIAKALEQDVETTLKDLRDETCMFFGTIPGAEQMADFMYRASFIEKEITMDELTYSTVPEES